MRDLKTIVFTALLLLSIQPINAQQVDPTKPPPPPPAEAPPAPVAPAIDPSTPPPPPPAEPAAPVFDPLHAGRSIDVGTFYLKKGNYDAAIDRFQEAARYQPKLAKPWVLLGEAYEKKHDDSHAIEAYKKYLDLFPGAEDASKVQKRIAALEEKAAQQASKRPPN